MKREKFLLSTLLVFLLLVGCSTNIPPIDFDENYLNQQIQLIAIKELNSFETTDAVTVLLNYNTTDKIIFPENYNLRLFVLQNNEWIEIFEVPMDIYPKGDIILSPEDPSSYNRMVTFIPSIADKEKKQHLRIYVFGELQIVAGETKTVSAYTDVMLAP
jgi:hypothetical protein